MDEKTSLKEKVQLIFFVLKLAFKANPISFPITLLLKIFMFTEIPVNLFISTLLVDTVISSINNNSFSEEILINYLFIYFITSIFYKVIISHLYFSAYRRVQNIMHKHFDVFYANKIIELGIESSENPEFLNLAYRTKQELYKISTVIENILIEISKLFFSVLSYLLVIFFLFPLFAVFIVFLTLVRNLPTRYFLKKSYKFFYDTSEERRKVDSIITELTFHKNIPDILVLRIDNFLIKKFKSFFFNFYIPENLKISAKWHLVDDLFIVISIFASVFIYYFIINFALLGLITVGQIVFYIGIVNNLISDSSSLFDFWERLQERLSRIKDVMKFFSAKPNIKNGDIRLFKLEKGPSIEFINVSFKYPNSDVFVYENLNLKINSGEKVAIVGQNGSGKTTLLKLIARFYDVDSGEVLINGINIKYLNLDDLYKNIAFLLQNFVIFNSLTIKQNVYIGNVYDRINEEKIIKCLKLSDAWDFVKNYKNGLNQYLSSEFKDGTTPSMGQAQKIAIARYFYKDSSLLILDEPTSAIDTISESKIFDNLYKSFDKKTIIIVSHKFSTIQQADRIIVLENGKILEQGTHQELIRLGKKYYTLYNEQAKFYKN